MPYDPIAYLAMAQAIEAGFCRDQDVQRHLPNVMHNGQPNRAFFKIFYSMLHPFPLLVLGDSPGGDPNNQAVHAPGNVASVFYEDLARPGFPKHDYVDCHWPVATAMRTTLGQALALDDDSLRFIPAANGTPARARGGGAIPMTVRRASIPTVKRILQRVQPSYVLTFGRAAWTLFHDRNLLCNCIPDPLHFDGPHGAWIHGPFTCAVPLLDGTEIQTRVICIRHPSHRGFGAPQWNEVVGGLRKALAPARQAILDRVTTLRGDFGLR